uniref:Uncharacterized protein n=1 Tax=Arundo donax TaxID=35708 RepID=A0A0A9EWJ5_ARUDO
MSLNPNAEPDINADSISLSDWVVLISGFTLRFSFLTNSPMVMLSIS